MTQKQSEQDIEPAKPAAPAELGRDAKSGEGAASAIESWHKRERKRDETTPLSPKPVQD